MAALKAFQALLILGGIFLIPSIYLLYPSAPLSEARSFSIPPGGIYYYYLAYSINKGGQLHGTFSETLQHLVNVYVLSEQQYSTFQSQLTAQGMFQTSGSSGTYSASIPSPGKYYIVVTHGSGFETVSQSVDLTINIDGYNLVYLGGGLGTLVAAVALFIGGSISKKKAQAKAPAPTASDVVVFDQPKPPEPP